MCIHCCRLSRTSCPRIPFSCPVCPVSTISSCCSLGVGCSTPYGRPLLESPRIRGWARKKLRDACATAPPRWLEMNRRAIYAIAGRTACSPEAVHYLIIQLLHANYAKVMMMSRKRRSFMLPLLSLPDQDLFSTSNCLFNASGYLNDPFAPETLGKLLRMMQNYIFGLRLLNKQYKWFGNGHDRGEILSLLGEQDELVLLLRNVFGGKNSVVPVRELLKTLNELDFRRLCNSRSTKALPWLVREISDLYSEVTGPPIRTPMETMWLPKGSYNQINQLRQKIDSHKNGRLGR
ncbi:hypothetical protein KR009_001910 [Drosophila setifemur]|nr:hypothetical protein KR009_001910 [Drosophila setifemur]